MATKITAAQRKHGLNSLLSTYTTKSDAIRNRFDRVPENRYRNVPSQILPSGVDALKALMGLESTAELKQTREEIAQTFNNSRHGYFNVNPGQFVKPTNQTQIDEITAFNEVITQRRRQEVDGQQALLQSAYRQACDVVALADSGDDVLAAIQAFEAREF